MKTLVRVVMFVMLALVFWCVGALVDYFSYQEPFWRIFIGDLPTREVYVRLIVSIALPGLMMASWAIGRLEHHVEHVDELAAEKWSKAFDAMADAVSIHGADFTLKSVNDALCELLGKKRRELVGKKCYEVFHGTHKPPDVCPCVRALQEKRQQIEEIYEPRIGRWFSITASPLSSDDGAIIDVIHVARDITARKQTDEERRAEETRYMELLNNMTSGVAIYDVVGEGEDFVIKEFNPAAEKIDKISRAEVVGKRVREAFPGVEEIGLFDLFRRVWRTGRPEEFSMKRYKDARIEGWRANYVYKLPSGEIVSVYNDVSERRRSEEARRQSEEKFKMLFHNAADAIFITDLEGRFLEVNEVACARLKYTREELVGRSAEVIDVNATLVPGRSEEIRTRGGAVFETVIRGKEGSLMPVELSARTIVYENGTAVLACARDITERTQAARRVEESEKNYRMIFESSPEAIFVLSSDGVLLDVNARACRELGYTREELVGLSIAEFPFLDEEGRTRAMEYYAKRLAGEKMEPYELTFVARAGHVQVGLVRGQLITDEQGIVTKDLLIVGDVTEQKKIADELTTRVAEIEKLNEFMLGREMRIIEVKKEVNELCKKLGEPPRYKA